MAKLGTVGWMAVSHGKLGLRDKMAMIYQGARAKAAMKKSLKGLSKVRYTEVDDILPPDSPIATEAMEFSKEVSGLYLFNHCLRSYFWSKLMDDGSNSCDDEAVFTALMLHDLGLTDGHRLQGTTEQCFTLVGAKKAQELAAKHQWNDRRSELVANAITLHLNIAIGDEHGREAQLVRNGTVADVAGMGLSALHNDQVVDVGTQYPRLNMKENILSPLLIEAKERPCCRAAFLQKKLDFRKLIRNAPFAE